MGTLYSEVVTLFKVLAIGSGLFAALGFILFSMGEEDWGIISLGFAFVLIVLGGFIVALDFLLL